MHIYIEIEQPIINDIFILKPIFSVACRLRQVVAHGGSAVFCKSSVKKNREFKVYITLNSLLLSVVQHTEPAS